MKHLGARFPVSEQPHLLAKVSVRAVLEFDAGEGAGELAAAGNPGNGAALIKEVGGVIQLDALLLDHPHSQHLALLLTGDELGGQHLQQIMAISTPLAWQACFMFGTDGLDS